MEKHMREGLLGSDNLQQWFLDSLPEGMWGGAKTLDNADTWVPGGPEGVLFQVLETLAQYIDKHPHQAAVLVEDENILDFIQVLAYTKTSPSIRLLSLMGQCQPGLGGDVVQACEASKTSGHQLEAESKVILARIKLLVRLECYGRIFGKERRQKVLSILNNLKGDFAS